MIMYSIPFLFLPSSSSSSFKRRDHTIYQITKPNWQFFTELKKVYFILFYDHVGIIKLNTNKENVKKGKMT